ncbi:NADH-quinone oxidoreductase subunit J family protein [Tengunoibacter tsumagoiensis]|uniref:NADH-quinone oxidoreductase subunit J n=1 Tax=Tengunoibacter tsumagoiensis TaxID=2014871 RepID=A0A401ZX51_9CHLR|nr:NADH-quinone oxidoreductase subunit J [Tengunoibacter tsumagoiensis]GCE11422.1 NADH-quinone oxidoreductase subunit J [Tengunoibacter tsumagoiensis]
MNWDLTTVLFWIFAALLVGLALSVVAFRNIVHSALALVAFFAMAAGIYVLLNAEFIAIVQILVYAGAVSILILFALMLTRITGRTSTNPTNRLWPTAVVICALVGGTIVYALLNSSIAIARTGNGVQSTVNNVVRIGQLLYSPTTYSFVLPFEIASFVLLVAIVGAIVIGRED